MLDPIFTEPLIDSESCTAHLLPKALRPDSLTLKSNRQVDNDFGRLNDSQIAEEVRDHLDGVISAHIHAIDPVTGRACRFPTKAKREVDPQSEVVSGTFFVQYPKGTSDEWRERVMGNGTVVEIAPVVRDFRRAALSSLHSGYLTACYHWGDEYIMSTPAVSIRDFILRATAEKLDDDLATFAALLREAHKGLLKKMSPQGIGEVAFKASELHQHPIIAISVNGHVCLVPLLIYSPSYAMCTFLPAIDDDRYTEYIEALKLLSAPGNPRIHGPILTPHPAGQGARARWQGVRERLRAR